MVESPFIDTAICTEYSTLYICSMRSYLPDTDKYVRGITSRSNRLSVNAYAVSAPRPGSPGKNHAVWPKQHE